MDEVEYEDEPLDADVARKGNQCLLDCFMLFVHLDLHSLQREHDLVEQDHYEVQHDHVEHSAHYKPQIQLCTILIFAKSKNQRQHHCTARYLQPKYQVQGYQYSFYWALQTAWIICK